jgi:hypothetical protein
MYIAVFNNAYIPCVQRRKIENANVGTVHFNIVINMFVLIVMLKERIVLLTYLCINELPPRLIIVICFAPSHSRRMVSGFRVRL